MHGGTVFKPRLRKNNLTELFYYNTKLFQKEFFLFYLKTSVRRCLPVIELIIQNFCRVNNCVSSFPFQMLSIM